MNLFNIEHVILDAVYLVMPALMKMTVEPIIDGMAMGIQVCLNIIHHLPLCLDVILQIFILVNPVLDTSL